MYTYFLYYIFFKKLNIQIQNIVPFITGESDINFTEYK